MDLTILLYLIPVVLISLTVHEYAHGLVAFYCGDDTAKRAGRLTLNPLAHLDPIGTIMMFIVHFGWAKPVPVNPLNLTNPKRDILWVSLAGPASNMIMALITAIIIRTIIAFNINTGETIAHFLRLMFQINIVLAGFNLIPLHPLDGSKMAMSLLPHEKAAKFWDIAKYGPMIIFASMIISNFSSVHPIGIILDPWYKFWFSVLIK